MRNITKISGRLGNQMFQFAYIYAQKRRGVIPDVYLQSEQYFKEFSGEIKRLYGDGIGFTPHVSIHVRRGDYVDNDFYFDLVKEGYYERAIEFFPGRQFVVFSDDIDYCKTIFKGDQFAFSEDNTDVEDLNMMASCKDHIISNSSYAWWGAWLSPSPTKKVIAPSRWFTDGIERIKLPSEWVRI